MSHPPPTSKPRTSAWPLPYLDTAHVPALTPPPDTYLSTALSTILRDAGMRVTAVTAPRPAISIYTHDTDHTRSAPFVDATPSEDYLWQMFSLHPQQATLEATYQSVRERYTLTILLDVLDSELEPHKRNIVKAHLASLRAVASASQSTSDALDNALERLLVSLNDEAKVPRGTVERRLAAIRRGSSCLASALLQRFLAKHPQLVIYRAFFVPSPQDPTYQRMTLMLADISAMGCRLGLGE